MMAPTNLQEKVINRDFNDAFGHSICFTIVGSRSLFSHAGIVCMGTRARRGGVQPDPFFVKLFLIPILALLFIYILKVRNCQTRISGYLAIRIHLSNIANMVISEKIYKISNPNGKLKFILTTKEKLWPNTFFFFLQIVITI